MEDYQALNEKAGLNARQVTRRSAQTSTNEQLSRLQRLISKDANGQKEQKSHRLHTYNIKAAQIQQTRITKT